MSKHAIELIGVERRLGNFQLGPLDVAIPRGAICGLIGANGAGKTTTLDMLMGMGRPDCGEIRMLGMEARTHEVEVKRRTAYVGPDLSYQAWGRIGEAVAFVRGFYADWDQPRCERLLKDFGLSSAQKVNALSFGERMKLILTLALARDAELMIMDEPGLGLDPVARRQMYTELLAFMQREERTIVISSHQLVDIERFADHVILLKQGKVMVQDRLDALVERYRRVIARPKGHASARGPGIEIVRQDTDRTELLVDQRVATTNTLEHDWEVISDSALTLEEIFLILAAVSRPAPSQPERQVA
jgi:ABC-type multidrug transport system ATPase subunit